MNLAEKLAATYLRLNGFLLLPQFTIFTGVQHNHVDIVALRAANSIERIYAFCLPVDDFLFDHLSKLRDVPNARESLIGVAAEVRTNLDRDAPTEEHTDYVQHFLGGIRVSRLAFFDGNQTIRPNGDVVDIGIRYAAGWIQYRIDKMLAAGHRLTKTGSWNWSESFLSDLLAFKSYGLLT